MIRLNDTNETVLFKAKSVNYVKKVVTRPTTQTATAAVFGRETGGDVYAPTQAMQRNYIMVSTQLHAVEYLYYDDLETMNRDYNSLVNYVATQT